jgi:hypothetical protein
MPHDANAEPSYPISQSELAEYRQLDARLKRDAQVLAGWRQSLIERMEGPESIEPGPLTPQLAYRDTGLTTQTEEGRVAVVKRWW